MTIYLNGQEVDVTGAFVREDGDELGYELVEMCPTCDGNPVQMVPGRKLWVCPECEVKGYVPHSC